MKINLENEKTIILYLEKLNLLLESHLEKKEETPAVELEIESVVNFLVGLSYSRLSTLYGPIQTILATVLDKSPHKAYVLDCIKYYNHFLAREPAVLPEPSALDALLQEYHHVDDDTCDE